MKLTAAVLIGCIAGSFSCAFAQTGSSGQSGSAGTGAGSGTGGGSTLSNGNSISGTGGSPGPNTSNALRQGTTGNNLGAPQTNSGSISLSSGNAVNTPAATGAAQSLEIPIPASSRNSFLAASARDRMFADGPFLSTS